jgi:stage V sporulation protein G
MEITEVKIRKMFTEQKLKAIVSVTFDGEFAVHDIKIIDSANGLFIAMPNRKNSFGEFRDVAHPITREMRAKISGAVLAEYSKALASSDTYAAKKVL